MAWWRSHQELVVTIIVLVLWAGCAKQPVDYQRTAAGGSAPAPPAALPVPPPGSPGAGGVQEPGSTADATPPSAEASTPTAPLVGAQRPSPSEFSATDALKDVYFDFDKYAISPDAAGTLMANAAWLKSHPGTTVLVEGHCDARGTVEYNLALGQRRAQSTRDFLLAQGIPGGRVATISYGKEKPACTESTEECRARNRRAHFLVKPS